ncbi:hypothetical protein BOTBODRAFT_367889 [Botryobasidium botryosum FD-172 SS1]|uniref:Uncharacterized protein n=1 Tax=Botryobasidium botryosum (strain FD-172 SS1) TaxID=930990 RepID=A0A067M1P7_BOTB1|nr:hypothetical protein BOTBODRAFT_367889 [Botryobasidium botryosum FD-172 SS1]
MGGHSSIQQNWPAPRAGQNSWRPGHPHRNAPAPSTQGRRHRDHEGESARPQARGRSRERRPEPRASNRRRSPAPSHRTASRSPSRVPHDRVPSPRRHAPPARRHAPPSRRRSSSPQRRVPASRYLSPSPRRRSPSPRRRSPSPRHRSPSRLPSGSSYRPQEPSGDERRPTGSPAPSQPSWLKPSFQLAFGLFPFRTSQKSNPKGVVCSELRRHFLEQHSAREENEVCRHLIVDGYAAA